MLKDYKNVVDAISAEISEYEVKPTKASSARIRKLSLQLGKQGAPLRQYMLKLDKAK
jgi:hypothetical protein